MSPELVTALKRLRLGGLIPTLPERLKLATESGEPFEDFLLMLLVDEISRRESTAAARRADEAGLDPSMLFERWDKTAKVTYDRRVLSELMSPPLRREPEERRDPRAGRRWKDLSGERAGPPCVSLGIQRAVLEGRRAAAATQTEPYGQLPGRADGGLVHGGRLDRG